MKLKTYILSLNICFIPSFRLSLVYIFYGTIKALGLYDNINQLIVLYWLNTLENKDMQRIIKLFETGVTLLNYKMLKKT